MFMPSIFFICVFSFCFLSDTLSSHGQEGIWLYGGLSDGQLQVPMPRRP
jgi:hypothetical protein